MPAALTRSGKKPRPGTKAAAPALMTKAADAKGRITLGSDFANKHVIVERISQTEVIVKMARVIPETEAWLYENPPALKSVRKGLAQAQAGQLVDGPDLNAGRDLAAQLEG